MPCRAESRSLGPYAVLQPTQTTILTVLRRFFFPFQRRPSVLDFALRFRARVDSEELRAVKRSTSEEARRNAELLQEKVKLEASVEMYKRDAENSNKQLTVLKAEMETLKQRGQQLLEQVRRRL